MFDLRTLLILIPAFPLVAAVVTAILGPRVLRQRSHWPTIGALALSFISSIALVYVVRSPVEDATGLERVRSIWKWVEVADAYDLGDGTTVPFDIDVSLRADGLTAMMLPVVTFIAMLVAVYASSYMQGDRGYWRFFTYVSLFVFSMTMLVLVSNFLLLYVFWEAVGVCSYLLIGFWYQKPEAAAAGFKAFLVNRVGDFGFAIAIFLIWISYGTLNFHDTSIAGVLGATRLAGEAPVVHPGMATAICLLLLLGACGKSAQFPLHVWLPDAMEGPTPVSALIHAATMVTAGVYMVARCTPLFQASEDAQLVVACVGGFTALMAGLIAVTQFDLKRILAYSTISQLGYMFLAMGTGTLAGIGAGMFHLMTHACFKALLFLGAGSVMHSMGNVIDIRRFGGLRHLMPWTHVTFLIGSLALAGIFPFSGFWSKDQIIAAIHEEAVGGHHSATAHEVESDGGDDSEAAANSGLSGWSRPYRQQVFGILYGVSLLTAFLTAFYTFRAYYMTFFGRLRVPSDAGDHAHESPPVMLIPLVVLAVCAFAAGFVFDYSSFVRFLATAPSLAVPGAKDFATEFHLDIAIATTVVAGLGIGLASYLYLGHHREVTRLSELFGPLRTLLANKFYFDEIYRFALVVPLRFVARASFFFDQHILDNIVNLCGRLPVWLGGPLRRLQSGLIPFYSLLMVVGVVVVLILGKMLWGGGIGQ